MKVHPLAETRSVDDQVEWLNNTTVIYGVLEDQPIALLNPFSAATPSIANGAPLVTNTWTRARRRQRVAPAVQRRGVVRSRDQQVGEGTRRPPARRCTLPG